jgi:hypothetical protein
MRADNRGLVRPPGAREVEREARRLLPVLGRKGAFAERQAGFDPDRPVAIRLRTGQKRPSATVSAAVFGVFVAEGWVTDPGDGIWHLADAGRAWLARRTGESGFADQHRLVEERAVAMADGSRRTARVNAGEDPLGWLARRRDAGGEPLLTAAMVAAGERLRADFTRAGLVPGVTTDWSALNRRQTGRGDRRGGGASDITDVAVAARARFERALAALSPEAAGLVVDICCFLIGLEAAESSRRWPKRSAKLVLRISLDQLARHYGLSRAGSGRRGGTGAR